jgi:hypothetical protein
MYLVQHYVCSHQMKSRYLRRLRLNNACLITDTPLNPHLKLPFKPLNPPLEPPRKPPPRKPPPKRERCLASAACRFMASAHSTASSTATSLNMLSLEAASGLNYDCCLHTIKTRVTGYVSFVSYDEHKNGRKNYGGIDFGCCLGG